MAERSLLDLSVRELLLAVSARTSAPGGGAAAALTTALSAALTGMAARFALPEGDRAIPAADPDVLRAVVTESDELRERAVALADADAAAYGAFLAAVRLPRGEPGRAAAIAAARDGAADVPGEIAAIADAVSALARPLVERGNPNLRGDAVAAVVLAAAAAAAAAGLVEINVGADPRTERARAAAAAAAARTSGLTA